MKVRGTFVVKTLGGAAVRLSQLARVCDVTLWVRVEGVDGAWTVSFGSSLSDSDEAWVHPFDGMGRTLTVLEECVEVDA